MCNCKDNLKRVFSKEYDELYVCKNCGKYINFEEVYYNKFKLDDFKTGMVVRLRNNNLYRVMLNTDKGNLLVNKHGCLTLFGGLLYDNKMEGYDDNLCQYCYETEEEWKRIKSKFDIMEVWIPSDTLWGLTKIDFKYLKCVYKRTNLK